VNFVSSIQITDSLVAGRAPIIEESLHQIFVLEGDVVDVAIHLTVECDSVGLALWTDASGPWGVILAAVFDATRDVLEGQELALVHSWCHFTQVGMERQVFDVVLAQVRLVKGFQGRAVDTTRIAVMAAPENHFYPFISYVIPIKMDLTT
jgi:hypothetical protein